jgi:aspartate aminotransferase
MSDLLLSKRALALKPSPTLAMANKARELKAQGNDVVSLTVGEPDWPTVKVASEAAIEAIHKDFTKYTAAAGIPELRSAIAKQASEELGVNYLPSQAVVGSGAKFVIYALLQMLVAEGDEVLIPSPYWVSYPAITELAGATSKIIHCGEKDHFKLSAEKLEKAISKKTKVLILCSPSNPTGILYNENELKSLAEVIRRHPHLMVISDDIYNKLIFSKSEKKIAPQLLNVAPDLKDQVVVVNGASKTYSMTGWRVGWALGPEKLMKATADLLSQSTSNVTSISQYATLAAIEKGQAELEIIRKNLEAKKNKFLEIFQSLKLIKIIPPDGAFYFWAKVEACFGKSIEFKKQNFKIQNSKDIAEVWLEKYHLAVVPGIEFGSEGYVRMSIAASDSDLQKAFDRLTQFEKDLK